MRLTLGFLLWMCTLCVWGQQLTPAQAQQLAATIQGNSDPVVVAALAARNDDVLRDYYNTLTTTDVWHQAVSRQDMFEAMNITQFDGLTAGKRDAWRLMMEQASAIPLDFGRSKLRSAVRDIWSTTQADALLQAFVRKATRAELIFGGVVEASGVVSATDLNVEVTLTTLDVSQALNANP